MVAALTTMSRPPNKPTSLQQPARTWSGWVSAHRKTIRNGAANARGTRHNGNVRAKLFHVSFLLSVHDLGLPTRRYPCNSSFLRQIDRGSRATYDWPDRSL